MLKNKNKKNNMYLNLLKVDSKDNNDTVSVTLDNLVNVGIFSQENDKFKLFTDNIMHDYTSEYFAIEYGINTEKYLKIIKKLKSNHLKDKSIDKLKYLFDTYLEDFEKENISIEKKVKELIKGEFIGIINTSKNALSFELNVREDMKCYLLDFLKNNKIDIESYIENDSNIIQIEFKDNDVCIAIYEGKNILNKELLKSISINKLTLEEIILLISISYSFA